MNWSQPKVYAVKHKDEEIRAASRSGGIFTACQTWFWMMVVLFRMRFN